jgi:hypothetical protein
VFNGTWFTRCAINVIATSTLVVVASYFFIFYGFSCTLETMRSVSNRGMFRPPLSRPNHVRIKGLNVSQPGHKFDIDGQLVAIVVFKLLILYRMMCIYIYNDIYIYVSVG